MKHAQTLRLLILLGIVLWLTGTFAMSGPAALWVQILGNVVILGTIAVAVVLIVRARRAQARAAGDGDGDSAGTGPGTVTGPGTDG